MHRTRRTLVLAAVLAAAAPLASAQQAAWPSKPIRLVVPYPPGGFTDILGRLIAERLQPALGQPVVVDNKGGGGSTIGTAIVATAPPDGYTLLLVAPDLAINESLVSKLPYDARKDFAPVIHAAWSPMVVVVHPSVPARTVGELISLAKAQPGRISFGSGGNGTGAHLALELFKTRAGIDLVHVPYKGNGPATNDLLGGQIGGMFLQYAIAKPHLESGRLRALATPSGKRSPALGDIPTIAESGLPGFDVQPWFGVVAPAGTPDAIVQRLNSEIARVMQQPDVRARLASQGAEATTSTPREFATFIDSEVGRWAQVVKASGAKLD